MRQPKAFPRQRSCRFRGRWISVKTLAFLPKDGRGRSPGRKHANRRYRRGTDLFRPGLAAGPPSPESLPSVAGEGFWSRQQLFLFPGTKSPTNQNTSRVVGAPSRAREARAIPVLVRGKRARFRSSCAGSARDSGPRAREVRAIPICAARLVTLCIVVPGGRWDRSQRRIAAPTNARQPPFLFPIASASPRQIKLYRVKCIFP